jgi:hypothetical protein
MTDTTPATDADDFVDRMIAHFESSTAAADADALAASPAGVPVAEPDAVLTALTTELRAAATWSGPPPALRAAILARAAVTTSAVPVNVDADPSMLIEPVNIDREPSTSTTPVDVDPKPSTSSRATAAVRGSRARWAWPRWGQLRWAVPVAALVAVIFTVATLAVDRALQPPEPPRTVYAAAGAGLAPQASARIGVANAGAGFSLQITAKDLPAAAPGSYYAAWLHGPQGTVPLGSFHQRQTGKPVTLWSGVDPTEYPDFTVTLQAEGDPPAPSRQVVLTATLRR